VPVTGWPTFLDNDAETRVDVSENDKSVKVSAELPGMEEKDIDVRVSDGMLTISGEKKADRNVDENGHILRERSFSRVESSLPDGIDPIAAQAAFKNGMLTINGPKAIEGSELGFSAGLHGDALCSTLPGCGAVWPAPHYFIFLAF
jgi:HSP20 family protein